MPGSSSVRNILCLPTPLLPVPLLLPLSLPLSYTHTPSSPLISSHLSLFPPIYFFPFLCLFFCSPSPGLFLLFTLLPLSSSFSLIFSFYLSISHTHTLTHH